MRMNAHVFRAAGTFFFVALLAACSGGAGSPPVTTAVPDQIDSVPAPPLTAQSIASLPHSSLTNVASSFSGTSIEQVLRLRSLRQRSPQSTELPGDTGFVVGVISQSSNLPAVAGALTAYNTDQFTLTYPPSGSQVAPATPPERFIGPEIQPGATCLINGLVYVNFGPGGTQRNGPGNPIEFHVGPYNAYRVVDLCTLDAVGNPTFFLTPITTQFQQTYTRTDMYGRPFIAAAVVSPSENAATNPNAQWYTLLYNFTTRSWEITHESTGNTGASPSGILAYPGSRNLPEVCPALQPLVAKNIFMFDADAGRFEPAAGPNFTPVPPDFIGNSLACFTADSTGPASYTFHSLGDGWVLSELGQPLGLP